MNPLPIVVDSTMMTTFRACPRKFQWEFIEQLGSQRKSPDLHAGGCFARALEVVYHETFIGGRPDAVALAMAEAEFHIRWGDYEPPEKSSKTRDRTWEAVLDYLKTYPPRSDPIQPFIISGRSSHEFTFAIPLDRETTGIDFPLHPSGSPFIFGGRFDTLGQMGTSIVVQDDKTMGTTPGQHWNETQQMRGQFLGYLWACRVLGIQTLTVVVRGTVILKTMIKQLQAIKKYSNWELDRWADQLSRDLVRMVRLHSDGHFDYDFGDACTSYGGCGYLSLCTSASPERWFPTFGKRVWNPINANPEE